MLIKMSSVRITGPFGRADLAGVPPSGTGTGVRGTPYGTGTTYVPVPRTGLGKAVGYVFTLQLADKAAALSPTWGLHIIKGLACPET